MLHLPTAKVQTYIFLKMAVAGHLTLFVARTRGAFWRKPYPAPVMLWSAIVTKLAATLLCVWGLGLIATDLLGARSAWCGGIPIVWAVLTDAAKRMVHLHLDHAARRHREFLDVSKRRL